MPSYYNCVLCNSKFNRIYTFITSIICVCIGLTLMLFLNKSNKPIGESISDHPLKVLGILLIVIGCTFSVMICVHCLITNKNSTPLSSQTMLTTENGRFQNQTSDWSLARSAVTDPTSTRTVVYSSREISNDTSNFHQGTFPAVLTPKPAEIDLPPSYEEVMGYSNTLAIHR